MTNIADKLLNLRKAALQCSTSMLAGWSHGTDSQYKAAERDAQALAAALAEVPDPDAIGECVTMLPQSLLYLNHVNDCQGVGGAEECCTCKAAHIYNKSRAALAKLEKR